MVCVRCKKEFEEDWRKDKQGIPRFCSRACANARDWSEKDKLLRAKKQRDYCDSHPDEMKRRAINSQGHRFSIESRRIGGKVSATKSHNASIEKAKLILERGASWEVARHHWTAIKGYIVSLRGNVCAICKGDGTWQGVPLSMDLDHEDGNPDNNVLENLRILCPNCHRITPFWGNSKAKRKSASPGRYTLEKRI